MNGTNKLEIVDPNAEKVYELNISTGVVSTVAGNGEVDILAMAVQQQAQSLAHP